MRTCWVVMALASLGCGPAEDRDSPSAVDAPTVAAQAATPPAALRAELHAPATADGGPVPLELVVRNTGRTPAPLGTGDSATTFDLVVADSAGAVVWSRLQRVEEIPLVLVERTLAPGAALRFSDAWDLRDNAGRPVPPGAYTVHGLLDTNESADLRTVPRTLVVGAAVP